MSERKKELTKQVILYIIKKLGKDCEGRKKLMKLMFLVDHYNIELDKINEKSLLGNEYFIYYYGVFSFDVMESYNELVREKKVENSFPIKSSVNEIQLPEEIKRKIDTILKEFGNKSGYQLEVLTLEKLGIKPFEKEKFFGKNIREIIKNQ